MLTSAFEQLLSIREKKFVQNALLPVLVFGAATAFAYWRPRGGASEVSDWWKERDGVSQFCVVVLGFVGIYLAALLVEAKAISAVKWLEGYAGPPAPGRKARPRGAAT